MIEQSLCHHLQSQLTEYYRLIAILESQLNIASNAQDQDARGSLSAEPDPRAEESGLTLKRLDVWVNEWRLRMRMMSVCVEAAKGSTTTFPMISFIDVPKIHTVVLLSTSFIATRKTVTRLYANLQINFLKR
jgi:hypothetical protein